MSSPLKPWFHLSPATSLGEAPIYRESDHTLHFCDIRENKMYILPVNATTGLVDKGTQPKILNIADSISAIYFRKNKLSSYVVLYYQGVGYIEESTGRLEPIKELIPESDKHLRRFNDGAIDPKGRFWAGEIDLTVASKGIGHVPTEPKPIGRLWRYDPDGSAHVMDTGLVCSNGIGWSPDLTKMYLNDSVGQKLYVFDYDNDKGSITNRKVLRDFAGTNEEPDGLVIDTEGNIWSAMWGGFRVLVMNPEGKTIREIPTEAANPTCPAWGGPNNDTLFVTSAKIFSPDGPADGQLFSCKVAPTTGMKNYDFAA